MPKFRVDYTTWFEDSKFMEHHNRLHGRVNHSSFEIEATDLRSAHPIAKEKIDKIIRNSTSNIEKVELDAVNEICEACHGSGIKPRT